VQLLLLLLVALQLLLRLLLVAQLCLLPVGLRGVPASQVAVFFLLLLLELLAFLGLILVELLLLVQVFLIQLGIARVRRPRPLEGRQFIGMDCRPDGMTRAIGRRFIAATGFGGGNHSPFMEGSRP